MTVLAGYSILKNSAKQNAYSDDIFIYASTVVRVWTASKTHEQPFTGPKMVIKPSSTMHI